MSLEDKKILTRKVSIILDIDEELKHGFKTYVGEDILDKDEQVCEYTKNEWVQGALFITNYRLLFVPNNCMDESLITSVPLATTHKLEKVGGKTTSSKGIFQNFLNLF